MRWKVTDPATTYPVTLAEAKAHARVDEGIDDDRVTGMLRMCTELAQTILGGKQIMPATLALYLERFPCGREIRLPMPPLVSVTSVQYVDQAGGTQTLDASKYVVDAVSEPGRVYLKHTEAWPTTECGNINAVTVTYQAGYASVPYCIKEGILAGLAYMYAYRGDDPEGFKLQLNGLLEMYLSPEMMLVG